MNWLFKNRNDEDAAETRAEGDGGLPFVTKYGTWCRTRLVRETDALPPEYLEAWQQDDGSHRWSLQKVGIGEKDGENKISTRIVRKNISFQQAAAEMAAFEHSRDVLPGEMEGASAEDLGFDHYRKFAEREGFVFDANNMPHERPHPKAQPTGRFNADDLDHAAATVKEAAGTPVVNRKNDLLSEVFNDIAYKGNFDEVLTALQNAGELESFGNAIRKFSSLLPRVGSNPDSKEQSRERPRSSRSLFSENPERGYRWTNGDYDYYLTSFDHAADALEKAYDALKTLGKRGHDTQAAEEFLYKCVATTYIVRAQGFFVLLKNDPSTLYRDQYAEQARAYEKKAAQVCRKHLGLRKGEDFDRLKQAVIQGSVTRTPDFVSRFLSAYRDWHAATRNDLDKSDYNVSARGRRFLGQEAFR